MAISLTRHAEIRSVERSSSVDLGHALFRKALRGLASGKTKQYQANGDKVKLVWNGWQFITKAEWRDTISGKRLVHSLITLYPTKAFRPS